MDNNANNMYDSIIAGYEDETEAVHNDAEETASTEKREPWVRNYTEEQRQYMARRKAAGELLPGHKRRKTIYHRTKFGQQDFFVLRFLLFARQASAPQIGFMLNRTQNTAYRRLLGLNEVKLVTKEVVAATAHCGRSPTRDVACLTSTAGYETATHAHPRPTR